MLKSFAGFLDDLDKLGCSVGGAAERKRNADPGSAHEFLAGKNDG